MVAAQVCLAPRAGFFLPASLCSSRRTEGAQNTRLYGWDVGPRTGGRRGLQRGLFWRLPHPQPQVLTGTRWLTEAGKTDQELRSCLAPLQAVDAPGSLVHSQA